MSWRVIAVGVFLVLTSSVARAGFIFTISNGKLAQSSSDQSGFLEVYVQSDTTPQPMISAHQIEITIAASSGITFEDVVSTSDRTYIGPGLGPPAFRISTDKTRVSSGDFFLTGSEVLFNDAGLARIEFNVPAGTVGDFPVMIDPQRSFLFDANNELVDLDFDGGLISIEATAIPEPAFLINAFWFAGLVFLVRRSSR